MSKGFDPGSYSNPGDILKESMQLCQAHGVVDSVRLFCRKEHLQRVFCMVHMAEGALRAAQALDGCYVIGTIVCRLIAVPERFGCARRRNGKMLANSCDDCFMAVGVGPAGV